MWKGRPFSRRSSACSLAWPTRTNQYFDVHESELRNSSACIFFDMSRGVQKNLNLVVLNKHTQTLMSHTFNPFTSFHVFLTTLLPRITVHAPLSENSRFSKFFPSGICPPFKWCMQPYPNKVACNFMRG